MRYFIKFSLIISLIATIHSCRSISPCYPSGTIAYKAEFGSGYQSHLITLSTEWSF